MPTAIQTAVNRSINDLHPIMRAPVKGLIASARDHVFEIDGFKAHFDFFEGYRSPERQDYLFTFTKSTKARPWKSAHQYGLAADFAVMIDHPDGPLWSWSAQAPWGSLKGLARISGLDIPISWDRGHVEHSSFNRIKNSW